jgi:hypothetical protein
VKEQLELRFKRWRPPWYYWLKFVIAWVSVMSLFLFIIVPVSGIDWILGKIGIDIDLANMTDNCVPIGIVVNWCIYTIDLWLERKKHQQFLLGLYEE